MDSQVDVVVTAGVDMPAKSKKITPKTKVKIGEKFYTVRDAAEMRGLTYDKVWRRVMSLDWTLRQALELDNRKESFPPWKQVTVRGQTHSVYYWCDITGVNPDTARRRITQLGWPPAQAVEMEPRVIVNDKRLIPPKDRPIIRLAYKGRTQDLTQWSIELGIPYRTLYDRKVRQKLTTPEVLSTTKYTAKSSPSYKNRGGRLPAPPDDNRVPGRAKKRRLIRRGGA